MEGHYSFPWITPLYPWYVPYITVLSKEVSSTIFIVFGMTWPEIELWSPRPLANTLPTRAMSQLVALFNPQLGDKGVHTFPKDISLKGNVIVELEFELANYDVLVQHFSHCTTKTPLNWFEWHVNPSRFILNLEVRESHSLHIHIHIFVQLIRI